jgi:hypothetical protein
MDRHFKRAQKRICSQVLQRAYRKGRSELWLERNLSMFTQAKRSFKSIFIIALRISLSKTRIEKPMHILDNVAFLLSCGPGKQL